MMMTVAVAVVAGACVKDRPVMMDRGEIGYEAPRVSVQTKDVLSKEAYPDYPFYIWAKYHPEGFRSWNAVDSKLYLDHVKVAKSGTVWASDPVCYWPKNNDATLSFFGLSHGPSGTDGLSAETVGVDNAGIYLKNYTVGESLDSQADVMVSNAVVDMKGGSVQMNFNHILSTAGYQIRASKDFKEGGYTPEIVLEDFRLRNIGDRGNFTQGLLDKDVVGELAGEQVRGNMRWTVNGFKAEYENLITAESGGLLIDKFSDDADGGYISLPSNIVLPQRTYRSVNDYVELYVAYRVDGVRFERVIDLNGLGFREFEIGTNYTFSFTVGNNNRVSFTALVDEWHDLPSIDL